MIRNDLECKKTKTELESQRTHLERSKALSLKEGLTEEQANVLIEPSSIFLSQMEEEIRDYENLRDGNLHTLNTMIRHTCQNNLGMLLIAFRIFSGISQRQLASLLKVDESQVSRDEQNEYFGITLHRASKILDVLGDKANGEIRITVEYSPRKRATKSTGLQEMDGMCKKNNLNHAGLLPIDSSIGGKINCFPGCCPTGK